MSGPTPAQIHDMACVRAAAAAYAAVIKAVLPKGEDRADALRDIRANAMWTTNVAVMRKRAPRRSHSE